MPIFEFNCLDCKNVFEDLFYSYDISNEDIRCPKCDSSHLERLFSLFSSPSVKTNNSCSSCNTRTCNTCSR